MIVVGLDLSLTATGVALTTGDAITLKTRLVGMDRLVWLRDQAVPLCQVADLVMIEGYSFSSRDSHAHALGELGGVIRLALWEHGVTYCDVPPANLKRYATGAGNAGKSEVLVEAVKRLGYQGSDNNQADAMWLRAMALDHYGEPVVMVPQKHRDGLTKVAWPTLTQSGLT